MGAPRRRERAPRTRNPEGGAGPPGPQNPAFRELGRAARAGFSKMETNAAPPPAPRPPRKGRRPPGDARDRRAKVPQAESAPLSPFSRPSALVSSQLGGSPARQDRRRPPPPRASLPAGASACPAPGSDDRRRSRRCPVGLRGGGGKMAAAGALERSFLELSGAERERPRHFREFTVCTAGTEAAEEAAIRFFPPRPSPGSPDLSHSQFILPSPHGCSPGTGFLSVLLLPSLPPFLSLWGVRLLSGRPQPLSSPESPACRLNTLLLQGPPTPWPAL